MAFFSPSTKDSWRAAVHCTNQHDLDARIVLDVKEEVVVVTFQHLLALVDNSGIFEEPRTVFEITAQSTLVGASANDLIVADNAPMKSLFGRAGV